MGRIEALKSTKLSRPGMSGSFSQTKLTVRKTGEYNAHLTYTESFVRCGSSRHESFKSSIPQVVGLYRSLRVLIASLPGLVPDIETTRVLMPREAKRLVLLSIASQAPLIIGYLQFVGLEGV
jgi:hypothetical protein